jgi:hypothetical protein
MKSKRKSGPSTRKSKPSVPLDYHSKISLTSIVIIFFCLSIALWSIRQQHQLSLFSPAPHSATINFASNLPTAYTNKPFTGTITATSSNPNSQLILSLTNTPSSIEVECTQHIDASFTDTCILTGTFTQAKPHKVLATVLDRDTDTQTQQWFTVQVRSSSTADTPMWIKM